MGDADPCITKGSTLQLSAPMCTPLAAQLPFLPALRQMPCAWPEAAKSSQASLLPKRPLPQPSA